MRVNVSSGITIDGEIFERKMKRILCFNTLISIYLAFWNNHNSLMIPNLTNYIFDISPIIVIGFEMQIFLPEPAFATEVLIS